MIKLFYRYEHYFLIVIFMGFFLSLSDNSILQKKDLKR